MSQELKAFMSCMAERSGNDCKNKYKVVLSNRICFKIFGGFERRLKRAGKQ